MKGAAGARRPRPRAARRIGRVPRSSWVRPPASSRSARTISNDLPKQGSARRHRRVPEQERHRQPQRGRPQHLPGEHHHLPAEPGRRDPLVRGLPDAVLRRAGAARPHRRRLGGGPERHPCPRASSSPRPGRMASSTSCRGPTTAGASTTARASSRRTAGRRRRPWRSSTALADDMQAAGHRPVRARQRRPLAGDGHVRSAQLPPERLPVPHGPDGRPRELDRRAGEERLHRVGGAAAAATRRTPTGGRGKRPRPPSSTEKPA